MNRYNSKTARWQQQEKEELRMNKTEFIKVRCTKEKNSVKCFFFSYRSLQKNFEISNKTEPKDALMKVRK